MTVTGFVPKDYYQIFETLCMILLGSEKEQFVYLPHCEDYESKKFQGDTATVLVQGIYQGAAFTFENRSDYEISTNKLKWKGKKPDPGTLFHVYICKDSGTIDLHVGSVTRTICEAFSWELAFLYRQMRFVYDAGFLDTSSGTALDRLSKMFGVDRILQGKTYLMGRVVFRRSSPAALSGDINIPEFTLLMTDQGTEYETIEKARIGKDQMETEPVRVRSRQEVTEKEEKEKRKEKIRIMPLPIAGVETVELIGELRLSPDFQETDESLRERCRRKMAGIGKCTKEAIKYELLSKGAFEVQVYTAEEPPSARLPESFQSKISTKKEICPGEILVVVDHAQEKTKEMEQHFYHVKAAGICGHFYSATPKPYKITVRPVLERYYSCCPVEELKTLENTLQPKIEQAVKKYFAGLKCGESPDELHLKSLVLACDTRIKELRFDPFSLRSDLACNEKVKLNELKVEPYPRLCLVLGISRASSPSESKKHDYIYREGFINYFQQEKENLAEKIVRYIPLSQEDYDQREKLKDWMTKVGKKIKKWMPEAHRASLTHLKLLDPARNLNILEQVLDRDTDSGTDTEKLPIMPFHLTLEVE